MALRRVFVESLENEMASIEGPKAHHLHRVARLRKGELVEISDTQRLFLAAVRRSSSAVVEFEIREKLDADCSAHAVSVTLGLSIFRFARLEWVIEKATELGVDGILPIAAARSDRRLVEAARKRQERWQTIAEEAAAQSRRLAPPRIEEAVSLEQALLRRGDGLGLFLDTNCPLVRTVLTRTAMERPARATLLIGPEGGWTGEEQETARRAGYQGVGLGPTILRTETAALAALAILAHWLADKA